MSRWDWGRFVTPGFCILLIAFLVIFAHSGLQGPYGLAALKKAERLETELEAELGAIRAERAKRKNLVDRLGNEFLDLDLLDERARAVLGYSRPEELIIR